jgi:hypothetical protein
MSLASTGWLNGDSNAECPANIPCQIDVATVRRCARVEGDALAPETGIDLAWGRIKPA